MPSENPLVDEAAVSELLALLEAAAITVWVDGGWGADALVGHQTRPHSDLDLALDREQLGRAIELLAAVGFECDPTADPGPPARHVMVGVRGRVDLHPLRFDKEGDGWQELDGEGRQWGRYPADGLRGRGTVAGRPVRCLTTDLQIRCHEGYEWQESDHHDADLLSALRDGAAG